MTRFQLGDTQYRLIRSDVKNLTIQRQTEHGRWKFVAYCGNSIKSLVRTLLELIGKDIQPEQEDLVVLLKAINKSISESITRLEIALKDNQERIKTM